MFTKESKQEVGVMGVSWHKGFVGILSFSLSAYDFTQKNTICTKVLGVNFKKTI